MTREPRRTVIHTVCVSIVTRSWREIVRVRKLKLLSHGLLNPADAVGHGARSRVPAVLHAIFQLHRLPTTDFPYPVVGTIVTLPLEASSVRTARECVVVRDHRAVSDPVDLSNLETFLSYRHCYLDQGECSVVDSYDTQTRWPSSN